MEVAGALYLLPHTLWKGYRRWPKPYTSCPVPCGRGNGGGRSPIPPAPYPVEGGMEVAGALYLLPRTLWKGYRRWPEPYTSFPVPCGRGNGGGHSAIPPALYPVEGVTEMARALYLLPCTLLKG
jgi:hypothetical protein